MGSEEVQFLEGPINKGKLQAAARHKVAGSPLGPHKKPRILQIGPVALTTLASQHLASMAAMAVQDLALLNGRRPNLFEGQSDHTRSLVDIFLAGHASLRGGSNFRAAVA